MTAAPIFTGSIPEYYDTHLGAAQFEPFAVELARRLPARPGGDVLEVACGTGLVTRHLRERLDTSIRLVATDFSKPMLDYARGKLGEAKIEWREADAASLPFGDDEFGAVVCAFGFMFVPDKDAAFSEARRVLKDGGPLLFDTWDRLEEHPHVAVMAKVLESFFPSEPEMRFTTPYEMHEPAQLRKLLGDAGFHDVKIEKKRLPLGRVSARTLAIGAVRGTPRSAIIEKRGVSLDDVIEKAARELAKVGGSDPFQGSMQALLVEAR